MVNNRNGLIDPENMGIVLETKIGFLSQLSRKVQGIYDLVHIVQVAILILPRNNFHCRCLT